MELSKLQVPTVRKREDLNKVNPETVKEDNDGSLKITRVILLQLLLEERGLGKEQQCGRSIA